MARITSEIERFFKTKSILSILIAINIAVYIAVLLAGLVSILFNIDTNYLLLNLQLPPDINQLLHKPWTVVTYMFTHAGFFHILFNLLWLYWFGKLFVSFFGPRPMGSLYFLGGIGGALAFIVAYYAFPYFHINPYHPLIGASASIMAIVFAAAVYRPNHQIGLLFLGNIKIIYIALVFLFINLITLQSTDHETGRAVLNNAGGFFAHIGGILAGVWFALAYKRGKVITKGISSVFDSVANLFKKQPKRSKMKVTHKRPETDMEYNTRKTKETAEIDRILDKIKHSGYDALTEDEKNKLFNAGNK